MTELESLVRGFFDEAINTHDTDAFPRFCGAGYVWHGGSDASRDVVGRDAFAAFVGSFFESFPDVRAEVFDVVAGRDRAAIRFRETATHTTTYAGIAPTGRVVSWDGVAIYRAQDGLLVEEWSVGDNLSLMLQIGAVVPADGAQL